MVTASATAVRAESRSESSSADSQGMEGPITAREMGIEEKTVQLLQKHQDGKLQFNEDTWRFLIENQVSDFAGIVQATSISLLKQNGKTTRQRQRQKKHLSSANEYFLSITEGEAKEHLYGMVTHDNQSVMEWAIGVLEDGNMLDLNRIGEMLGGEFYNEQKPALEILTRVDKPYYEPSDIERLKELKSDIENGFEKRGEVFETEVDGVFSSSTEKV